MNYPASSNVFVAASTVQHYETRRLRKDGTVIDVSVAVSPISTRDGEVVGVSVVGRDISERKQAEEALAALGGHR